MTTPTQRGHDDEAKCPCGNWLEDSRQCTECKNYCCRSCLVGHVCESCQDWKDWCDGGELVDFQANVEGRYEQ